MSDLDPFAGDINIRRLRITDSIGGLGIVGAAAGVAWFVPQLRWLAAGALVGGVFLGLGLLAVRHRRVRRVAVEILVALGVLLGAAVYYYYLR